MEGWGNPPDQKGDNMNFLENYFNNPLIMLAQSEESLGEYHEMRTLYQINKGLKAQEEQEKMKKKAWEEYKRAHQ